MMMFEKTDEDLISEIEGENLKTSLVESFEDSAQTQLYESASSSLLSLITSEQIAFFNTNQGILTSTFNSDETLSSTFTLLHTASDFIASAEHKIYPFVGVLFLPEFNA